MKKILKLLKLHYFIKIIFVALFYFVLILMFKSIDQDKISEPTLKISNTDTFFDRFDIKVKYWADNSLYKMSKVSMKKLYINGFIWVVIYVLAFDFIAGFGRPSPFFELFYKNKNGNKQIKR